MKFPGIFSFLMLFSISAIAKPIAWNRMMSGGRYLSVSPIKIQTEENETTISEGTSFKLVEKNELSMVKLYFYKFKYSPCSNRKTESDLQILPVAQASSSEIEIALNLSKNCEIDIFVEMNDYSSQSLFN